MRKRILADAKRLFAGLLTILLLVSCGGGGVSEPPAKKIATAIGDISGNWQFTAVDASASPDCDGTTTVSTVNISQTDNTLEILYSGSRLTGTMAGDTVTLSGSYPSDGGTVNMSPMTLTVSADCLDLSGKGNWSWTDGTFACSGTTTINATRLSGDGCAAAERTTLLSGTPLRDVSQDIVVDEARQRILITGFTEGNLEGQSHSGDRDIFVSEYDMKLKHKWTTLIGTSAYDNGRSIVVTAAGDIYVSGSTASNLAGQINNGLTDAFLARLDSTGKLQWVRLLGTSQADISRGLALDSGNNVYISGGVGASLDGRPYAGGVSDMFLARYDSNGNRIWVITSGGAYSDLMHNIAIDRNDNIFACGWYSTDGAQIYLARYTKAGTLVWEKIIGETGNDFCRKIATDSTGNIYITGHTATNLGGITNQGGLDIVIGKYDGDGNEIWLQLQGSAKDDRGHDILVSGDGSKLYVTGRTTGNLSATNMGDEDIFLSQLDTNGMLLSTVMYGTPDTDRGTGLALSSNGYLYITGQTRGDLDEQINAGDRDIFIKKIPQ